MYCMKFWPSKACVYYERRLHIAELFARMLEILSSIGDKAIAASR